MQEDQEAELQEVNLLYQGKLINLSLEAFKMFDLDGDGEICAEDLTCVIRQIYF